MRLLLLATKAEAHQSLSLLVLISGLTTPMHQTHLQKEIQKMKLPQHKLFERLSRFDFHH